MNLNESRHSIQLIFASIVLCIFGADQTLAAETTDWSVINAGDTINSAEHEGFPTITKDGLALYFARGTVRKADGSAAGAWYEVENWDIYVSERADVDAPWGEPQRLPDHINTDGEEHSVSFSPDGHWMYFSSNKLDGCGGLDIFRSYRSDVADELGWQAPENLGCEVNTPEHDVCVIYHQPDGSALAYLYFVSNREGTTGSVDSWRIAYDPASGDYSEAENIYAVSSPGFDGHLDPEAGYIWADREGGFGAGDLWHSDRDSDGNWLAPVNLGDTINTEFEEQLPSPYDHGRIIYFPSNRPGGNGNLDIYLGERSDGG